VPRRKPAFNDFPFAYHQEIEVDIVSLTNEGRGIARVPVDLSARPEGAAAGAGRGRPSSAEAADNAAEDGAGEMPPEAPPEGAQPGRWVVMVPFVLPGERARVRVYRNHRNYSEADLVDVLVPSPRRRVPVCPLFGRCGGCQYQHFEYAGQLEWKRRQVEELLRRLAGLEHPVDPVTPSPLEYGYRSKITPHYPPPREGRPPPLGFLREGTRHDVLDVGRCDLASDAINSALSVARERLRARAAAGELRRGGTLLLRDTAEGVVTDFNATALARVGRLELEFPAGDFFQNNPHILEAFTECAAEEATAGGARFLVDAYCGSGLFALSAAHRFERVAGVEISAQAVERARANALRNGIAHAEFLAADAAAIFAQIRFPAASTAVLLDPPRRGSDEVFLRQLVAFGPRTIVYVSCNPATQMRDLRFLSEAGYRVQRVRPFDLFPQTRHLECVVSLARP
jgi:23S rRNA (uracil1939-C5)-methyltransferase/tRNA (uracil-5-)-methyltransferase